jgi:hypothetical protein
MAKRTQSTERDSDGVPQLDPDLQAPQGNSTEDGTSRLDSIARRAYEHFEMRGGEHGRDQEDWFAAERELSDERQE